MKLYAAFAVAIIAVAPASVRGQPAPAAPTAVASRFTLDTPIETIAADPAGKAVLDANFPEMLGHPNYPDFKSNSLTQVQPMAGGAITDAQMAKAKAELAVIK